MTQPSISSGTYRPDIDGLRAVAVLLVVFYHAGFGVFSGGFVGVDVFFVISGYLITKNIVTAHYDSHHVISDFYRRRVQRIIPAFIFISTVVLIASFFIVTPIEQKLVRDEVFSSLMFVSNIYFIFKSDYFSSDLLPKIFIHTWSLSIEEQFYLFWPLFMIWVGLRRPSLVIYFIVLSLLSCAPLTGINKNLAFYFPLTRIWELAAGAALAWVQPIVRPSAGRDFGLAGLMLIMASGLAFSDQTHFPGLAAILPVAGAMLVILSAQAPLLAFEPLRRIGLISYSLYLWHWPIFALARYRLERELAPVEAGAAIVLAIALSIFTYRFVEQPARRVRLSTRWIFACALAGALALAGLAEALVHAGRESPLQARIEALGPYHYIHGDICHSIPGPTTSDCTLSKGRPKVFILSDSHGMHLAPIFDAYPFATYRSALSSCAPLITTPHVATNGDADCVRRSSIPEAMLARPEPVIVIAGRWATYLKGETPGDGFAESSRVDNGFDLYAALGETVRTLRAAGKNVILLMPTPEFPYLPNRCLLQARRDCAYPRASLLARHKEIRDAIARIGREQGARVIDPLPYLCPTDGCPAAIDGVPLYVDAHHLARDGVMRLKPAFDEALRGWVD